MAESTAWLPDRLGFQPSLGVSCYVILSELVCLPGPQSLHPGHGGGDNPFLDSAVFVFSV